MADNITMIAPSMRVPEVPTNPRVSVNQDLAQGLMDFARGVDRVAAARSAYTGDLRKVREEIIAEPSTDFQDKTRKFVKQARLARERHHADPNTGPRTPAEKEAFDADADAVDQSFSSDVERRSFEKALPEIRDRLFGDLSGLASDAVMDDTGRADVHLRRLAVENVDRHVQAGILNPEERDLAIQSFDAAVQDNAVRRAAERDPAMGLALLDQPGSYPALSDAHKATLREGFDTAVKAKQAGLRGELDAAMQDLASAYHGKTVPTADVVASIARLADATGDPRAKRAAAAADAGLSFTRKLGRMPLEDGVKIWQQLEASPDQTPERDAALTFGSAFLKDMDKRLNADPLGFAAEQGFADVEPLDLANADPLALRDRAKTAQMVAAFYRLPEPQYLTSDERQSLGASFKGADPAQKLKIMSDVTAAFGGAASGKLFREMDGVAPAEAHLANLALLGQGREAVARRGFMGQQAIEQKSVTMPTDAEFAPVEGRQIGAMFDVRLTRTRAQLIGAARALYAERAVSLGLQGFDPIEYGKALDEAAGRSADGGGIGVRNGQRVMLPMDMTQDRFNASFDGMQDGDLAKVSVTGGVPVHVTLSGKVMPATAAEVRGAYPVVAGNGRYRFSMTDPATGRPQYLADGQTGNIWEMDLSDARKRPNFDVQFVGGHGGAGKKLVPVPVPKPAPKMQDRVPQGAGGTKMFYDRVPAEGQP